MYRLLFERNGFVNVFVAILMVVLLGCAALAIDVGMLTYEKSQLQKACDAAALAGAQELPDDIAAAGSVAIEYADENGLPEAEITAINITAENRKITVEAERIVPYSFARALGLSEGVLTAKASAMNEPVNRIGGLRPFGVVLDLVLDEDGDFMLNQDLTLEFGAQDNVGGNFGSLAFDGTGVYEETIVTGSKSAWQIGDEVPTEPGGMVGLTRQGITDLIDLCDHIPVCTPDDYQSDCSRLITVPLVDGYENGRSTVTIVGFARFFIEDVGNGGNVPVTGRFIAEVTEGESNPDYSDFGLRTVKLTE